MAREADVYVKPDALCAGYAMSPSPPRRKHVRMLDEAAHSLTRVMAQRVDSPAGPSFEPPPPRRLCHRCQLAASSQQVVTHDGRVLLVCADCALPVRFGPGAAHTPPTRSGRAARSGRLEVPVAWPHAREVSPLQEFSDDDAPGRLFDHAPRPAAMMALPSRTLAAFAAASQAHVSPLAHPSVPASVRRVDGAVPPGYKLCNLCGETQPIASFPTSGERIKPYCHSCMPSVRRGMQLGMKMQTLREIYGEGGLPAVQAATGAHAGPSHAYGTNWQASSVTTRARSASDAHRPVLNVSSTSAAAAAAPEALTAVAAAAATPDVTEATYRSVDLLLAAANGTLALYDDATAENQQCTAAVERARGAADLVPCRSDALNSPARVSAAARHNFVHATRMDRHVSMAQRSGAPHRPPLSVQVDSSAGLRPGGAGHAMGSPDGHSRLPAAFRTFFDGSNQQAQRRPPY